MFKCCDYYFCMFLIYTHWFHSLKRRWSTKLFKSNWCSLCVEYTDYIFSHHQSSVHRPCSQWTLLCFLIQTYACLRVWRDRVYRGGGLVWICFLDIVRTAQQGQFFCILLLILMPCHSFKIVYLISWFDFIHKCIVWMLLHNDTKVSVDTVQALLIHVKNVCVHVCELYYYFCDFF